VIYQTIPSCAATFLVLFLGGFQSVVEAAEYPVRQIRFIVPNAPGGNADIVARLVGQRLSESFGQPVIIDNRPGASAIIGTELAAKAAPDGYTILAVAQPHTTNPSLAKQLPYDTVRDFAPISLVGSTPLVLTAHPSLPVKNIKGLIALAKSKPGTLDYGTARLGSGSPHIWLARFSVSWPESTLSTFPIEGLPVPRRICLPVTYSLAFPA
jgi:tripartite-type tricarboxylate transporter receptor subunit TctC